MEAKAAERGCLYGNEFFYVGMRHSMNTLFWRS